MPLLRHCSVTISILGSKTKAGDLMTIPDPQGGFINYCD